MNRCLVIDGLYCYQVGPIDCNWMWLHRAEDVLVTLSDHGEPDPYDLRRRAVAAFVLLGMDVDRPREEPGFFVLPGENEFLLGYAAKEDNNGTTYIASPVPLPWLIADESVTATSEIGDLRRRITVLERLTAERLVAGDKKEGP